MIPLWNQSIYDRSERLKMTFAYIPVYSKAPLGLFNTIIHYNATLPEHLAGEFLVGGDIIFSVNCVKLAISLSLVVRATPLSLLSLSYSSLTLTLPPFHSPFPLLFLLPPSTCSSSLPPLSILFFSHSDSPSFSLPSYLSPSPFPSPLPPPSSLNPSFLSLLSPQNDSKLLMFLSVFVCLSVCRRDVADVRFWLGVYPSLWTDAHGSGTPLPPSRERYVYYVCLRVQVIKMEEIANFMQYYYYIVFVF